MTNNNDHKKPLLYQDLPSLPPRISREERKSWRRKGDCPDCRNPHLETAKNQSKNLYFFYLVILAIGVIAIQIYNRQNKKDYYVDENSKQIFHSITRRINITLITQQNRHGISVLFRNNSNKDWQINNALINIKNKDNNIIYPINQSIEAKDFYSLFIPLPTNFNVIEKIDFIVD